MNAKTKATDAHLHLRPASLSPSPFNPRQRIELDDEFLASIKAQGIVQQIVARNKVGGGFEIVVGHRRHAAAKKLGLEFVPVVVRNYTDQQVQQIQLVENAQRSGVSPIEEAIALKRLTEGPDKMKPPAVATTIGQSPSYVYQRLQLLKLGKKVQGLVIDGKLDASLAVELARVPDEKRQADLADNAIQFNRSVRDVRNQVEQEMKRAAAAKKLHDAMTILKGKGVKGRIVAISSSWDRDSNVYGPYQFRLAGKKSCAHVVTGVYATGKNAGTAVKVCVTDTCRVHNKEEAKRRAGNNAADVKFRRQRLARKLAEQRATEIVVKKVKAFDAGVQRILVAGMAEGLYWEQAKTICERLELTKPEGRKVGGNRNHNAVLVKHILKQGGKELARLGVEIMMNDYHDGRHLLARHYKVDIASQMRKATRELAAADKKAKAAKKAAKRKGKVQTSAKAKKAKVRK